MKKVIALTLAMLMALSLVACGGAAPASTAASTAGSVGAGATIATLEDLNGKKIGVQLGTTGDIYAQDIEGAEIKQFNKGADAVLALKQGKIDAVIIDNEPAKVFASKNPEMTILPEDFAVEDYAICISKDKA
ncbi:MAG: transporter substrate-binding domain-containing protein, partial [Ruthenibacterium sp.]